MYQFSWSNINVIKAPFAKSMSGIYFHSSLHCLLYSSSIECLPDTRIYNLVYFFFIECLSDTGICNDLEHILEVKS